MALSNEHRWILIGRLRIRVHENAHEGAPSFTLEEIMSAIGSLISNEENYQVYGRQESKLLWVSDLEENEIFYKFLFNTGDKATSSPTFVDFETKDSREVQKHPGEGGHYNGHILIQKEPDSDGLHKILVEKVPNVYFGSLKKYLTWVSKKPDLLSKTYAVEENERKVRPIFDLLGDQSNTIGEALRTGILKDIKFVGREIEYLDGLDEEGLIKDAVRQAKFSIGKRIPEDIKLSFFRKISDKYRDFKERRNQSQLFIRIETSSGQVKTTTVDEEEEILGQAFFQNEKVENFTPRLSQRHEGIRQDMVDKMIDLSQSS